MTLSITSATGDQDQVVEVVLSVSSGSGPDVGGWIVDVEYDPAIARAESCVTSDNGVCNEAFNASTVRFVGTSNEPIGELGRARLRLIGDSGASAPLRARARQCISGSGGDITCSDAEGTLRID